MFIASLRSPWGGNIMNSLRGHRKPANVLTSRETGQPVILDDYYVYDIGYATTDIKRGDRLAFKDSDARKLLKMLQAQIQ